jgi:GNAT superfamily N-acetyltransferase
MKRFSIFRTVIGTGLFFGIILGVLSVVIINLPMKQDDRDSLTLALVLLAVVLSQAMVNIENKKEKFLRLFTASFITFCFMPLAVIAYFMIDYHGPVETKWTTLLGIGALICAILSFFVLFIRENSKTKNTGTDSLIYREAQSSDIKQIQIVRHLVKENTLSDPALVTDSDCEEYINLRGKGWVCEVEGKIVGFAIADLKDHTIWALFIDPEFEKKGIGRKLHELMLDWYFIQTQQTVWLSTAPGTRAEGFYRKAGWKDAGMHGKEVKFEMSFDDWVLNQPSANRS